MSLPSTEQQCSAICPVCRKEIIVTLCPSCVPLIGVQISVICAKCVEEQTEKDLRTIQILARELTGK